MSMPAAVATGVVTLLVVFGPGLAGTYLLGLRGLAAWALAPVLSCVLVGLETVGAQLVGLHWSVGLYVACSALVAVAAWGVGWLLRGTRRPVDPRRTQGFAGLGIALGAGTVLAGFAASIGTLRAVPAQPDATYHLNLIRWIMNTGDASSRDGGVFLYARQHSFYPSAFHAIAATVGDVVHQQPIVLANALAVVAAATVWVSGAVLLCRQAFGPAPRTLVFGGLAAGAFTSMPYWMGGYGVLWPYLLGMSLLPGMLACALSLLGLAQDDLLGRPRAAVVAGVGVAGLGLVHPHAVSSLALVLAVLAPTAAVQRLVRRRTPGAAALALVAVAAPLVLWVLAANTSKIRAMAAHYAQRPEVSLKRGVYQAVVNAPRGADPLWVTSILVLVGVAVCAWRPATRWVATTWVGAMAIFVAVVAVQSSQTRALTVFWYSNSPRLAALVPVVAVPALAAGLTATSDAVERLARRWAAGSGARATGAVTAAVLVLYLGATLGNNHGAAVHRLRAFYHPRHASVELLSLRQADALRTLARSIPADAVVADNPWRGHALLYAFTSRQVAFYSEKAVTTPDREVVADHLADAGTPANTQVCAAVRALRVTYAITGGSNELTIGRQGRNQFAGIDDIPGQPGFTPVATVAPYTLWRITACG